MYQGQVVEWSITPASGPIRKPSTYASLSLVQKWARVRISSCSTFLLVLSIPIIKDRYGVKLTAEHACRWRMH